MVEIDHRFTGITLLLAFRSPRVWCSFPMASRQCNRSKSPSGCCNREQSGQKLFVQQATTWVCFVVCLSLSFSKSATLRLFFTARRFWSSSQLHADLLSTAKSCSGGSITNTWFEIVVCLFPLSLLNLLLSLAFLCWQISVAHRRCSFLHATATTLLSKMFRGFKHNNFSLFCCLFIPPFTSKSAIFACISLLADFGRTPTSQFCPERRHPFGRAGTQLRMDYWFVSFNSPPFHCNILFVLWLSLSLLMSNVVVRCQCRCRCRCDVIVDVRCTLLNFVL